MKRHRRRLGFRFKDPDGSEGMENLVGHSETKPPGSRRSATISWDSSVAAFRLGVLGGDLLQVRRSVKRRRVSAAFERRFRGDGPSAPLATERFTVTAHTRCRQALKNPKKQIQVVRRVADLLPAVVLRSLTPPGPQRWTLLYLHGLGSSALENYGDRPHYFFDGTVSLKVVIPTAPRREVSCFDGWWERYGQEPQRWRLVRFNSWYDYISNYDGKKEDKIDVESLLVMRRALHHVIRQEGLELGGRFDRVIVGGKSQGCCTSLDALLTFPKPLGGFVGTVGHILSCTPVEPDGPQVGRPLHFFHEPQDDIMQWSWVRRGEERLRAAGHRVRARRLPDPEDHGHFIEGVEGTWIRQALRSICRKSRRRRRS